MATDIHILTRKRGAIKHKLTNFCKYFETISNEFVRENRLEERVLAELQLRMEKLETVLEEFEEIHMNIIVVCEEGDLDNHYKEQSEFTDNFNQQLSSARHIVNKCRQIDDALSIASDGSGKSSGLDSKNQFGTADMNVRLPPINLPKFNADIHNWMEFKDTFESLIHNNESIGDIQKYHYLRASLGEEAIKIIQSLEFSSKNYKIAWEILCNRFDNSRLLINTHIKGLFSLPLITKESSESLRDLLDSVNKHLRALATLKLPTEHWDALIIFIVSSKLDKVSAREWERYKVSGNDLPTLEELKKFLKDRADFLSTFENSQKDIQEKEIRKGVRHISLYSENSNLAKCNFCNLSSHSIYKCEKFARLSVPLRWEKVNELKLCSNCLCKGHFMRSCKGGSCKKCRARHSTLLHNNSHNTNGSNSVTSSNEGSAALNTGNSQTVSLSSLACNDVVLLSTAIIQVFDVYGDSHKVRAILDSGSQSCFISENLCSKLQLKTINVNLSISGINNTTSGLHKKCNVSIRSMYNTFQSTIQCFILPKITDNLPGINVDINSWKIPSDFILADPQFNISSPVDILIGANLFYNLLLNGQFSLGRNLPMLQNTVFGYVISGNISHPTSNIKCHLVTNKMLHEDLQKFWDIENIQDIQSIGDEELLCEKHFMDNFQRNSQGQFVVRIPFKCPIQELGDSRNLALSRFYNLERKFERDNSLKTQYIAFMEEYLSLGHMSPVVNDDSFRINFYLPHHGVLREQSLTTKLRVVFNGSAVTTSGKSLNSIQHVGPSIHNNLFDILVRFRQHDIVVTSDVEKMYRCILVHQEDRPLQRILWRSHPAQPVLSYELNTVTYGTASAPYLAIRCLRQLATENESTYPNSSRIISQDFYVDDLITGFSSEDLAIKSCREISKILSSASFRLRKWMSNKPDILKQLRDSSDSLSVLDLGDHELSKTLGIHWSCNTDQFYFKQSEPFCFTHPTKRKVLSCIAKVFDPLGLLSPATILLKVLMQKLWLTKLDWDDVLPHDLEGLWCKFQGQLVFLNKLEIPRHALCENPLRIEIHGFSDASNTAYCAAVYVRSFDSNHQIYVNLLCAKTKVAPTKVLTIPRLELCGALLLARLMKAVCDALRFSISVKTFLWCDSQIVLYWINSESQALQTFVSNRVSAIKDLSKVSDWNYVNTKSNPADVASRGIFFKELHSCELWWNGPKFLRGLESWPAALHFSSSFKVPELRNNCKVLLSEINNSSLFERYSQLSRLKRVTAYCIRFIENLRKSRLKQKLELGPLTASELGAAMTYLVRIAQQESFSNEIEILSTDKSLKSKHRLLALSPFIDSNGLLRVGGRLKNSSLSFSSKHPLLLDGRHKLSKLILHNEHIRLLHAGPQLLLASVRQQYWPTSGINSSKSIVRNCIKCFRHKPRHINSIMGDLPKSRVTTSSPFTVIGIDYAGPFILKDRKSRGAKKFKAYLCLFICLASKALHLELVTDLTTEAFIATLRRFSSRRGTPTHIYSDNATNFVGANKELQALQLFLSNSESEILEGSSNLGITWHFIPPNSPNFGGLWEANIKGAKYHLSRVIGDTVLTYEEFYTLLVQVEATLNSRPLYPLSSDPSDLQPLTPAHFLIGKPLVTLPDAEFHENVNVNQLSRFQLLQILNKSFWKQWSKLYLNQLQQRHKWQTSTGNLKIGQLVIIKQDNLPPSKWILGRVLEVHPGSDDVVRVVTLKTGSGILKRSISKVCPLPLPQEATDNNA